MNPCGTKTYLLDILSKLFSHSIQPCEPCEPCNWDIIAQQSDSFASDTRVQYNTEQTTQPPPLPFPTPPPTPPSSIAPSPNPMLFCTVLQKFIHVTSISIEPLWALLNTGRMRETRRQLSRIHCTRVPQIRRQRYGERVPFNGTSGTASPFIVHLSPNNIAWCALQHGALSYAMLQKIQSIRNFVGPRFGRKTWRPRTCIRVNKQQQQTKVISYFNKLQTYSHVSLCFVRDVVRDDTQKEPKEELSRVFVWNMSKPICEI